MPARVSTLAVLAALTQVAALPSDSLRPRNARPIAALDAAIFARDPAPQTAPVPSPGQPQIDSLGRLLSACGSSRDSSDTLLARLRDSLSSTRRGLVRLDSLRHADSLLSARRSDTLATVRRFDSATVQLDELTISDTSLSASADRFSEALLAAALHAGFSVRRAPLLPGVRNCTGLRASFVRRGDTTWLRLARVGLADSVVVADSVPRTSDSSLARMERTAIRRLYGPDSIPPESDQPWHWGVRVGILAASALLSFVAMASLW